MQINETVKLMCKQCEKIKRDSFPDDFENYYNVDSQFYYKPRVELPSESFSKSSNPHRSHRNHYNQEEDCNELVPVQLHSLNNEFPANRYFGSLRDTVDYGCIDMSTQTSPSIRYNACNEAFGFKKHGINNCRSPNMIANEIRNPKISNEYRGFNSNSENRSPKTSYENRSPKTSNENRSPKTSNENRSPKISNETRSPKISNECRSPKTSHENRSPKVSNENRSHKSSNDIRSPKTSNENRKQKMFTNWNRSAKVVTCSENPNASFFGETRKHFYAMGANNVVSIFHDT